MEFHNIDLGGKSNHIIKADFACLHKTLYTPQSPQTFRYILHQKNCWGGHFVPNYGLLIRTKKPMKSRHYFDQIKIVFYFGQSFSSLCEKQQFFTFFWENLKLHFRLSKIKTVVISKKS